MEYEAFPHKHFPVSGPSSVTQLILGFEGLSRQDCDAKMPTCKESKML